MCTVPVFCKNPIKLLFAYRSCVLLCSDCSGESLRVLAYLMTETILIWTCSAGVKGKWKSPGNDEKQGDDGSLREKDVVKYHYMDIESGGF